MSNALIEPRIFRQLLSWRDGRLAPVEPFRPADVEGTEGAAVPEADVIANKQELVIHVDAPGATADTARVLWEPGGALHVLVHSSGDDRTEARPLEYYRRFDFANAFDAGAVVVRVSFGVVTLRVPRKEEPSRVQGAPMPLAQSA